MRESIEVTLGIGPAPAFDQVGASRCATGGRRVVRRWLTGDRPRNKDKEHQNEAGAVIGGNGRMVPICTGVARGGLPAAAASRPAPGYQAIFT